MCENTVRLDRKYKSFMVFYFGAYTVKSVDCRKTVIGKILFNSIEVIRIIAKIVLAAHFCRIKKTFPIHIAIT
jgi:hypothetical protein